MTKSANILVVLFVALSTAAPAFACSGPGAQRTMLAMELLGYGAAALTAGVAAILLWKFREVRLHIPALILACLHPGWWVSAGLGDCGALRGLGTLIFGAPLAGIAIVAVMRHRKGLQPDQP